MNFHFKKALEEAKEEIKSFQTFEKYAEIILRSSVKKIKTLRISSTAVISFAVTQSEYAYSPEIFVLIREQDSKNVKIIYQSDFSLTIEEILSVFEIIKKHLQDEGFNCKDTENSKGNTIKRFYIFL